MKAMQSLGGFPMTNSARYCYRVAFLLGFALTAPGWLHAQQSLPTASDFGSLYSHGVNAYFAGRSSEAESYLSQALGLNPHDPRVYYFRALTLLRLGRLDEARGNMMVGASLEAQRPNRYAIGRALEQVQGAHRLMLEQYRRQARTSEAASPVVAIPHRTQRPAVDDSFVLRRRVVVPLDRLMDNGGPQTLSADELARRRNRINSRSAGPAAERSRPSTEMPAEPELGGDPFRDDPTGHRAASPGPRLSGPAETAAEPVAEPAAQAEENPFGDF